MRRPVDQMDKAPQEAVWETIRALEIFTLTEVVDKARVNRKTARDYLKRLMAGGYVEPFGDEEEGRMRLIRQGGIHPPRLKRDGSPVTQGGGTMNMWRTMRMLKTFTPRDLVAHANTPDVTVSELTARSYCSMLLKAGYLRVMQKAVPGKRQATYKFVRNTGPMPPQIQRVKQVYDPNLGEVTFYPGART